MKAQNDHLKTRTDHFIREANHEFPFLQPLAFGIEEAAQAASISKSTLKRLISSGQIRVTRIGRRVIIPRSAIEQLIEYGAK